ncbi:MAG: hypothetical protein OEW11_09385 [Nitrospirota bacterium]|nr:hypothetical protein [Nitrospirota bacterium]
MGTTQKNHLCQVCAKPSEQTICPACEAKIRGEILDEKGKVEKAGHTETTRH